MSNEKTDKNFSKGTDNFGFCFDNTYLSLPSALYTVQVAKPVTKPQIVLLNEELAKTIGLDVDSLINYEGESILSGNHQVTGSISFAQAYSGHQFGYFNQLGDGRALMIGEHITPDGQRVDIQLKGSGPTPYSRRGDGRAALSPMLREYLISEAMAGLGVPTTRSLAVVTTGETVYRETPQEGAILTRMATSHIRVGTFQYAATRGEDMLRTLFNYTLNRHYPKCFDEDDQTRCLLYDFAKRQAKLIALWQSIGFVHGVMNTDNVSLAGETIDYGPCAFMDQYHPDTVFSSIDTSGRYRYKNQPLIGKWNLARFAETLIPLFSHDGERIANEALDYYDQVYETEWLLKMRNKLGLSSSDHEDLALVNELLVCMERDQLDYNETFKKLTLGIFETEESLPSALFKEWYQKWLMRLTQQPGDEKSLKEFMKKHNPAIIPRNQIVQRVLNDWVLQGDAKPFKELLGLLSNPYLYTDEQLKVGVSQKNWPKHYTTTCGT